MISEVAEVDWSDVCNSVDVNEAYGLFSDKLLNIL